MSATLYTGGAIVTLDAAQPRAAALATRGDGIVAVGGEAACRSALGADFEHVDLAGHALLPGFIDTHLHPIMLVYFDLNADLRSVRSIAALQDVLRRALRDSATRWSCSATSCSKTI